VIRHHELICREMTVERATTFRERLMGFRCRAVTTHSALSLVERELQSTKADGSTSWEDLVH
jgi:hypothetical protein